MNTTSHVVLTPALGTTVTVSSGTSSISVYANSPRVVNLLAKFEGGTATFEQIDLQSSGNLNTYKTTFPTLDLPERISIFADGVELQGEILFIHEQVSDQDQEFSTELVFEEDEDTKSLKLDWLNVDDWKGWAWYRPRETWIEASFTALDELSASTPTHSLLLRSTNPKFHSNSVLAVFPASPPEAFVHLSAARAGEEPGVYIRARRVKRRSKFSCYVCGKLTTHKGELSALPGAINLARKKYGYPIAPFTKETGHSPFDGLGFCTWSSIGEDVPLTLDLMDDLVHKLAKLNVPVGTFIIDDGWQDIRYGLNGSEKTRGLWSFDTRERMNSPLSHVVSLIKRTLPTVKDVGVWMTLHGYWNSIAPTSPLAKRYHMQEFKLNRDNIQGIDWPKDDFDGQQTGSISNPEKRTWWLPPPHLAHTFWKDYFTACFDAGISFVKVDDQAYGSLLDGVSGGETFVALWNGMTKAANEVFGENKVIHCMAHYERTFNGDIGMGVATQGEKIVIRNSDDFGLKRPDVHRNHIHYNLYNAMLTSNLCLIPDPDMFMTSSEWPEYHAILRAFFEGPVLLADKPGQLDMNILNKLVGKSTRNNYEVVRAPNTIRPLLRNVWEACLSEGVGPAIKGVSYFPKANSASIVLWNARTGALDNSVDIIYECDIFDALEGVDRNNYGKHFDFAMYLSKAGTARSVTLGNFERTETTSSIPVMSTLIGPQGTETISIAPYQVLGDVHVASLGLIDKYAGLAAIQGIVVTEGELFIECRFSGVLGFIVMLDEEDVKGKVTVTVDSISIIPSVTSKGETLSLIEVDFTNLEAVKGKDSWTVRICV